jgi:site-specific DNA-cytosine methylase
MNVLSLFDGISCGRLALERAGIPVATYYASEIDKHAIAVSKANWPDIVQLGDVCSINPEDLPKIDLIFAGSPCQGFSSNGKHTGLEHKQSRLFWEFIRLLRALKPKYFLLENVSMKQEWRDIISKEVGCEPLKINSSLVSAQSRPRLYWTNIPGVTVPEDKGLTIFDILEFPAAPVQPMVTRARKSYCLTATHGNCLGKDGLPIPSEIIHNTKRHQRTCIIHDDHWRMLSPVECERLQTVPDEYTSSVTQRQRYRCLGNGWTVDVIAHLLSFKL